jgi:hypothetical protein
MQKSVLEKVERVQMEVLQERALHQSFDQIYL